MSLEFYRAIKSHAERNPGHPAIIEGDAVLSYKELVDRIEKFAGALESLDLQPESKLGIMCLNQKEYLICLLAGFLKGVPVIPYNVMLSPEDLAFITRDAGIDTVVVDAAFVRPQAAPFFKMFKNLILIGSGEHDDLLGEGTLRFEEFCQNGDADQANNRHKRNENIPDVILYTSGTTARPKGVMLNEDQFYVNTEGVLEYLPFTPDDRIIMALPLFHSFGNIIALVILRTRGTLILLRQFAPKAILQAIARHGATILPLVPTIYSFLVDLYARGGYDVSTLRYCISGGAALPTALLHRVEELMDVTVIEGYGLTETAPVIAVNTYQRGSVPGSVGPVLNNVEIKIAGEQGGETPPGEVGEICVRGPSISTGYWNRPDETREAFGPGGWFKTGDLGHLDEEGLLYISAGRKKDLIIRAGENVSPLAIENALMNHPAVAEAAAIGIPDNRLGEKVKVCVALRQGATAGPAELKDFCRGKLPPFMIPDIVQIYPELPKGATGKILKTRLREESGC